MDALNSPVKASNPENNTMPKSDSAAVAATRTLPQEIFKAYDIRGIVGKTLTPEIVELIGQDLGAGSGVAVTGSHNPPDYNGLKMVIGGITLSGDMIQKLRARILNNDLTSGQGTISSSDVRAAYLDRVP